MSLKQYTDSDSGGEPSTNDPLAEYEPRGYATAIEGEGDERRNALDAAVALTASNWGPPFATPYDDGGKWWKPAYDCACKAVERAIVDAIVAEPPTENAPTDEEVADTLGVDVRELRAFVDRLEEPRTAAVLGWAAAAPGSIDTVEVWLDGRAAE